jgi:hypothetical protein
MSIDHGEIDAALSEYYSDRDLPHMDPVQKFVVLVLCQAQRDRATGLVIEEPRAEGMVPIRYQVDGTWYEMTPFPEHIRESVAQTVIGMVSPAGAVAFPWQGEIDDEVAAKVHLKWHVSVAAVSAPIHFQRA